MIKTNSSQLFNAMNKVCSTSFRYVNKPPIRKRLKYRNKSHCNNWTTGPFTVECDYCKHRTLRGTSVASNGLPASYRQHTGPLETVFNFWGQTFITISEELIWISHHNMSVSSVLNCSIKVPSLNSVLKKLLDVFPYFSLVRKMSTTLRSLSDWRIRTN